MLRVDEELDRALRTADPARTPLSTSVDSRATAIRDRITSEATHPKPHRIRRIVKITLSAALTVGIIGGGSMALAGDGRETPWGWIADNVFNVRDSTGGTCFNGIEIRSDGVSENDPIVVEAERVLQGLDIRALDTTATESEIRRENAKAVDLNGVPSPITLTDAQVKQAAINQIVADHVFDALREKGFDLNPSPIHIHGRSEGCGG